MKIFFVILVFILYAAFFPVSCQKDAAVSLAVDFTSQDVWQYTLTCDIGGTFTVGDSISDLSSTIECLFVGKKTENHNQLLLKAENVDIVSNVLDDVEINHVTDQMYNASYTVALNYDLSNPHDSLLVPMSGMAEWDLYRQLIKVLPSLPDKSVRPGFSWEREKQFPLTTSQGSATCEVYQSFTFDSVRTTASDNKRAYISWLFRYAVDEARFDTASHINRLPLAGNGKGAAVLSIDTKSLISADMVFTTPACSLSDVSVQWEEKASLVLVPYR